MASCELGIWECMHTHALPNNARPPQLVTTLQPRAVGHTHTNTGNELCTREAESTVDVEGG